MANSYGSWRTGIQIDNIYPIGSIYISVSSTNPGSLIGGTWESIGGRFLIGANSTYTAGTTGGNAVMAHTHEIPALTSGGPSANTSGATTLTTAMIPAHTHDKGTYSITGMIRCYSEYNKGNTSYDTNGVSGAFYFRTGTDTEYGTTTNMASGSNDAVRNVQFQANRSWSGASGSTGSGNSHTHTLSSHTHSTTATTSGAASNTDNMPPYLAVYMWKRIS